ncbi:hypothetical protein BH10ACI2_BH10ACI2_07290 [soil metagenome]
MSTIEQNITKDSVGAPTSLRTGESIPARFLKLICSVRFGVTLLVLLGLACLAGMLIMQQNVDGFERYFDQLTPATKLLYGSLGLFNIYHAWYFNALLCLVSLNIILASIDRFPKAWKFFSKPTVTVPIRWLHDQKQNTDVEFEGSNEIVTSRITAAMKKAGWKKVITGEKGGRTFIMGQSGTWNRLGAYAVHVGLLTIFTGGFMTAQFGHTGQMPLAPGQKTNTMFDTVVELEQTNQVTKQLPFEVTCTDMQQKLIKKDGSIGPQNTIDWMTRFTIKDETGTHEAAVQMNKPFDYRGYRFFQASFTPIGRARNITIKAKPADGEEIQEITIPRDGSTVMANGTKIDFSEFRGNFRIGQEDPNENTSDYPNPAAVLKVSQPGSPAQIAYAFGPQMANMPVSNKPVGGYTFQLSDFEKVADQHVLSVQRDPGSNVVYVGFILLFLTLVAVFFFSHQRVWAAFENDAEGKRTVIFGGNSNRSLNAFDEKFRRFIGELSESPKSL